MHKSHVIGHKNSSVLSFSTFHCLFLQVGIITMLQFDGGRSACAQLQRRDSSKSTPSPQDDAWVDVVLPSSIPNDPIWVINIADCLSELSHGELPSTLHRVMPQAGQHPRNCLALFMGLDPSATLELKDRTVTYEEWRKDRIAQSQAVLRSKQSK